MQTEHAVGRHRRTAIESCVVRLTSKRSGTARWKRRIGSGWTTRKRCASP